MIISMLPWTVHRRLVFCAWVVYAFAGCDCAGGCTDPVYAQDMGCHRVLAKVAGSEDHEGGGGLH